MRYLTSILLTLILCGCNLAEEVTSLENMDKSQRIWVFTQFNVPEENNGLESYYYYGKISESLYNKIANNELNSGFITLTQVRYWGNDDVIHNYADLENTGELIFRIENISKIDKIANEPLIGLGLEQFDEPRDTIEAKQTTSSL